MLTHALSKRRPVPSRTSRCGRSLSPRGQPAAVARATRGEPCDGAQRDLPCAHGHRSYVSSILRSRFCLVPAGDIPTPGRRLADAIAAGCVPIVIGDVQLPLSRLVAYSSFAGFISRAAFLRDAVLSTESTIAKLTPQLPQFQRALADARKRLLYGIDDPWGNASTYGDVAELLLRDIGRVRATAAPAAATLATTAKASAATW